MMTLKLNNYNNNDICQKVSMIWHNWFMIYILILNKGYNNVTRHFEIHNNGNNRSIHCSSIQIIWITNTIALLSYSYHSVPAVVKQMLQTVAINLLLPYSHPQLSSSLIHTKHAVSIFSTFNDIQLLTENSN